MQPLGVRRFFRRRRVFRGPVVCLCFLEVACELFFSVRAPLPDGAHLVGGQVLAAPRRGGTLCGPGPAGARFGVFAHDRIVAHDPSGQKTQTCNVAESPSFPGRSGASVRA